MFTFGRFSLDIERRELRREGQLVAIEPQVFDVLVYLVRNRDRVVSRDNLLAAVWRGRIVSESTLSSRINAARSAVGDTGIEQRLIRTIARKGFRFVAEVRERNDGSTGESPTRPQAHTGAATELGPLLMLGGGAGTAPSRQSNSDISPATEPVISGGRERRQLTILASDLGEQALSALLDPEDLSEAVAASRARVRRLADKFGGLVASHTPEGVLVCFGYPQAREDDAERAVRAGLALAEGTTISRDRRVTPLQPRVGIATGTVVVGEALESGTSAVPDVVGEAPHLAMRLLTLSEPGAVMISTSTRRLVGRLFDYGDIGGRASAGVGGPLEAFRVLSESMIASRFEALRSIKTEIIGREEELELLLRRWSLAKTGEGRVVLVWGEPGIGKSRLVATLQEQIKTDRHANLLYFCSPHRGQTALHPVITQLERAAGLASTDSEATKLEKLEVLLAPRACKADLATVLFAELLSIPIGRRYPALALSPQRRKELVLEHIVSRLVALASRQPVLIVLEDAHWIDPTTRELFDVIVERIRTLPVLLVLTYRPEFSPPWLGRSHVTALTLTRLGHRENALMITRLAGGKSLPPVLLEQIISRTDGVPLFIEELTKSVLESGVLREEDGAWAAATEAMPTLGVPETLEASLVARLDRIRHVRRVGQTGAALGREFGYSVLKAILNLQDTELAPLLEQLVASELVQQRGAVPDAVYTFKHALVQDAVYATLLRSERAQLQARIVDVIENEFPETRERNPDVLAYHCSEAALWEKAIDYRLRASSMALDRSAAVEAQAQVEMGISVLPKIATSARRQQLEGRLQVALGSTFIMTRGFSSPDVSAALTRARALLEESIHPVETLRAMGGLFQYHLIRSEAPLALQLCEPLLKGPLEKSTGSVAHFFAGAAHLPMGNFKQSQLHLQTSLSLYDEVACRPIAFVAGHHIHSFMFVWLGLATLCTGAIGEARAIIAAGVHNARRRAHPFTLVSALLALARFLIHVRDLRSASAAIEKGFRIATDQRSPYHISRANVLRAVNLVESNQPEEAIALMNRALIAQRETGANFQSSFNLSYLALAYARTGDFDHALMSASQAIEEVDRSGERWWAAEAQRVKGEILLVAHPSDREQAEQCFLTALDCARQQGARIWELRAALSLTRLWRDQGRRVEALDILNPIYSWFPAGLNLPDLRDAQLILSELASGANR
jgi:DNA-binding winged helix-turn-helix (wHTH) protein/class 3 adenylate cyclase/tetratricopeptide (TPR) repeat protein